MSETLGELELPKNGELIKTTNIDVMGWALSTLGEELDILIKVDDEIIGKTKTGIARLDVETKLPNIEGAYESGFLTRSNIWKLRNSRHKLNVLAKTKNSEKLIGSVDFTVDRKLSSMMNIPYVGSDFKTSGKRFYQKYLVNLGGLKADDKVLDVGCAMGRIAMPLTKYLTKKGCYEGLDIVPFAINWCTKHITPKFPNFQFTLSDIYNKNYHPDGKFKASEYKFPYKDESFDYVFLASVFTHLLPKDLENYFSEILRVLKKGGKCLITYFIINEESLKLMKVNRNYPFDFEFEGFRTINKDIPEAAVAYDEEYIRNLHKKNHFEIKEPIHYGSWCGRKNSVSPQDFIIATKINF